MKATIILVATVWFTAILEPKVDARSALVDRVTVALEDSFDSMNSKRNAWFNNYSSMNNMTKTTTTHLREINMVSKLVLPLMWQLYAMTVRQQKKQYTVIMNERQQSVPFHGSINHLPLGPNLYLEVTLLLQQHQDFQVQILKGLKEIFFLKINFNERRAAMGHTEQSEVTEEAVLADDHFPAITLNQPLRINVQVMDDCIVASILLTNLHLAKPMPLPEKHIWCTRDYSIALDYSVNIHPIGGYLRQSHDESKQQNQDYYGQKEHVSDVDCEEENGSHESQNQEEEGHEEEASGIKLISAVVYGGFIYE